MTLMAVNLLTACKEKKETAPDKQETIVAPADDYYQVKQSVIDSLNSSLSSKNFSTPEEIIEAVYPKEPKAEGKYSYTITKGNGTGNESTLTLISEGIPDDSMYALKVEMAVINENGQWKILRIKEAYKCWPGRGHEEWGAAPCS